MLQDDSIFQSFMRVLQILKHFTQYLWDVAAPLAYFKKEKWCIRDRTQRVTESAMNV